MTRVEAPLFSEWQKSRAVLVTLLGTRFGKPVSFSGRI